MVMSDYRDILKCAGRQTNSIILSGQIEISIVENQAMIKDEEEVIHSSFIHCK